MFWKPEGPLLPGAKGLVAKAALEIPEVRTRCLDRASQLMTSLIRLETLTNRVGELTAIVRPILTAKSPNGTRRYEQSLETLSSRMAQRISSLEQQMAGVKRLIKFEGTNGVALSGWMEAADRESPARPAETGGAKLLTIRAADGTASKLWRTTVWLEGGSYRIEGRVKVQGVIPIAGASGASPRRKSLFETFFESVVPGTSKVGGGAGFLAFSHRKLTDGVDWDWFPFRESRDLQRRGELPPSESSSQRLAGDSEWVTLHYDFELRQPIADLDILCELRASEGTAWFDLASVTIRKR